MVKHNSKERIKIERELLYDLGQVQKFKDINMLSNFLVIIDKVGSYLYLFYISAVSTLALILSVACFSYLSKTLFFTHLANYIIIIFLVSGLSLTLYKLFIRYIIKKKYEGCM